MPKTPHPEHSSSYHFAWRGFAPVGADADVEGGRRFFYSDAEAIGAGIAVFRQNGGHCPELLILASENDNVRYVGSILPKSENEATVYQKIDTRYEKVSELLYVK